VSGEQEIGVRGIPASSMTLSSVYSTHLLQHTGKTIKLSEHVPASPVRHKSGSHKQLKQEPYDITVRNKPDRTKY